MADENTKGVTYANVSQLKDLHGEPIYPIITRSCCYEPDGTKSVLLSGRYAGVTDKVPFDEILSLNQLSLKSIRIDYMLKADSWVNNKYIIENSNIRDINTIVELYPGNSITREQYITLQDANIVGGEQITGKIVLTAFDNVPTIDIPLQIVFRGDT